MARLFLHRLPSAPGLRHVVAHTRTHNSRPWHQPPTLSTPRLFSQQESPKGAYCPPDLAAWSISRWFLLDLSVRQTDNYSVTTVVKLIYSPSDTPKSLWRGFAFMGPANASPTRLPTPAHDSGSRWYATPFLYGSCIRESLPVLTGAFMASPKLRGIHSPPLGRASDTRLLMT